MAKQKGPAALNSRVIRISLGTYRLLKELATKNRLTIAEALHSLITDRAAEEAIVVPRSQIPLVVVARPKLASLCRTKPAVQVTSIPTPAVRVIGTNVKLHVNVAGKENSHGK